MAPGVTSAFAEPQRLRSDLCSEFELQGYVELMLAVQI